MVNLNGSVKIDTELTYYYGNSLGGILGDVYMASTVDVKKGASILVCMSSTIIYNSFAIAHQFN